MGESSDSAWTGSLYVRRVDYTIWGVANRLPWLRTAFSGEIRACYTSKDADLSVMDADGIERGAPVGTFPER